MLNLNKERKVLLGIGAVLLLMGAIYRFGPEWSGFGAGGEEIALKRKQIAKYQQQLQQREALNNRLIALNRLLERQKAGLLSGDTPALAGVDIQNILNGIAARSGVQINSLRVFKETELDPPLLLSIQVQFDVQVTIDQFKEILKNIESATKMLRVIEVRAQRMTQEKDDNSIKATLTVEGFMEKK